MKYKTKVLLITTTLLGALTLAGCGQLEIPTSNSTVPQTDVAIEQKLVDYTNRQSSGPNKNYYWENGKAKSSNFLVLKKGKYKFTSDKKGRSSVASAKLTYAQYLASKGSRQGTTLDPPSWPKNKKVAISFKLTGRVYHGYMYNRSHSIADSLLGKDSYTSKYNFTTGTRSQNVGADQNGGMRATEEVAENYWKKNPHSSATIQYQTTPVYHGSETIPRGSIVDIKSSDGRVNKEIVVINSAEGHKINYKTGAVK